MDFDPEYVTHIYCHIKNYSFFHTLNIKKRKISLNFLDNEIIAFNLDKILHLKWITSLDLSSHVEIIQDSNSI